MRQIRPYTFNLQPFLADKRAIQQGFLGSEPFSIRQQAGFDPVVLLVADAGFSGYAQLFAVSDTDDRRSGRTSCSASSMPPSRAGSPTSTATRRRAMP